MVLHNYVLRVQYSCGVVLVFWFWQKIVFGVTYVLSVQYSCGVVLVFWFWQKIVFGVTYVLSVQYSCAVVSVFLLWQEIAMIFGGFLQEVVRGQGARFFIDSLIWRRNIFFSKHFNFILI